MKVIAVTTDMGQTLCSACATEIAAILDMEPWEVSDWEPMSAPDLAKEARAMFRAIKDDAIDQYPEFVEARIDPVFVAQIDSAPHCDKCGRFLVTLEAPGIEKGGPLDR